MKIGTGLSRKVLAAVGVAIAVAAAAGSASAQELMWIHRFGGEAFDLGMAVEADESGAYVAGAAVAAIPGEAAFGAQDAFVRKVDPSGAPVWTDQFGTADFDRAEGVAVDETGVYVAGWTRAALPGQASSGATDAFVRKYDVDGAVHWTNQFGTSGFDEILDVAVGDGAVYLVGTTQGQLGPGGGGGQTDIFVRKLDGSGGTVWTRQLGGSGPDTAEGLAVRGGSVYVVGCAGWFCGTFGNADAYVARIDAADGALVWERTFGVAAVQDEAHSVAADASGVYVGGWTMGTLPGQASAGFLDAFVRKYTHDGVELWTRQLGSASDDRGHGVAAESGVVYLAGVAGGALPGQVAQGFDDVFVAALDGRSGESRWLLQFGTRDFETARAVTAVRGALFIAGDGVVFGRVVFPTTLPDAFVARIAIEADETPPAVRVPELVVVDSTSPAGAIAEFGVTAEDDVDGHVPVACEPSSGSAFPIGTTTVTCRAQDAAGNVATASFPLHVRGAEEQLGALLELIETGVGSGGSLAAKLRVASAAVAAGSPAVACRVLGAFAAEIRAQDNKSLTTALAAQLLAAAARVEAVLGCSS